MQQDVHSRCKKWIEAQYKWSHERPPIYQVVEEARQLFLLDKKVVYQIVTQVWREGAVV